MKRLAAALVTTVMFVTACATDSTAPEAPEETIGADAQDAKGSADDRKEERDKKKRQRHEGSSKKKEPAKGEGPGDGSGSEKHDDHANSTDNGNDEGEGASDYPAAGTYSFAQSGYEEFCDTAGNCDKQRLPSRQPVSVTYENRKGSSAVVVTEQKASRSRLARTWTEFTPEGARISKVYVRFEYSGFRFERTYVPEPAVEALRFPFKAGASWSGQWRASTSGSYRVKVGARRSVSVGDGNVEAFPVETTTEFRGDFEGRSRVTTYIDPRTRSIVAAEGVLNVTSQFGRYTTVFDTRLVDGPGY